MLETTTKKTIRDVSTINNMIMTMKSARNHLFWKKPGTKTAYRPRSYSQRSVKRIGQQTTYPFWTALAIE
jgi:hypothetical protein